jgi:hypothetical protein
MKGEINMKKRHFETKLLILALLAVLSLAVWATESESAPPPVAPPVVREGDFALELATALNLGEPSTEVDAESLLGTAGVAPRNGWIADYPVTPDIIGELRDSIIYAAQAKTISMDRESALKAFEEVQGSMNILVGPAAAGPPPGVTTLPAAGDTAAGEIVYPDSDTLAGYYSVEGPPIVTYYAPPPDYYYLYAWVPYPYWWGGVWFGGFFVLHDFHRNFVRGGRSFAVSNHFNDVNAHRVFRVDPVNRASGRTFAGVGAPRANNFIGTGVQRAPERIFNSRAVPRTGSVSPLSSRAASVRQPAPRSSVRATNPFPQNRVYSRPPGAGRAFTPRSGSSGGSRSFSAPSGVGGRSSSAPSGGGGHPGGGGGGKGR